MYIGKPLLYVTANDCIDALANLLSDHMVVVSVYYIILICMYMYIIILGFEQYESECVYALTLGP
jgi:hypothetical protein